MTQPPLTKSFNEGDISGLHILIVDDYPAIRRGLVFLLEAMGAKKVSAAQDGAKALEILKADKPDLVMTDGNMPVMDGFELARQIRVDKTLSDLPIVFMSAKDENEAEALQAGANVFLSKGSQSMDQIGAAIQKAISLQQQLPVVAAVRSPGWKPA